MIAEGVEDELTLKRLATLGCDLAQGYHLSPPLPGEAFSTWIEHASSASERPHAIEPSSAIAPDTIVPAELPRAVATA